MNNPPRYDEVFVKGVQELFDADLKRGELAMSRDTDEKIRVRKEWGMSLTCTADELDATPNVWELVAALKAEIISLGKDNANLIEMNFNLEQQYSAIKEDLDQANESCEEWKERCDELESDLEDLRGTIEEIRDLTRI
jgi:cytochrome c556